VIRRSLAVLPLALAIGLMGAGCGSDSSGETSVQSVSIPAITSPVPTTPSTPVTTAIPSTTSTTKGSHTFNPAQPDSETNDIPPAKGSPEAAFEKQCKQQGTCG
jgi:hypothetical protein